MSKAFASTGDLEQKKVTFAELAPGAYAYTAEGDPNTGVIVGDDGVMVIDAQATPRMAEDVIAHIRTVTDKPIKYVLLTHYHAVRVLGASGYNAEQIIASRDTYDLIVERGQQDYESELGRFPRLFQGSESIPGLTWPTIVFENKLTVFMGKKRVEIMQLGRGHTKGDTVVWLPEDRVLYSGDLVEYGATPYTGDAYLEDWPQTLYRLAALNPARLVPGRGDALMTPELCGKAINETRAFVALMYQTVKQARNKGASLRDAFTEARTALEPQFGGWVIFEHCLPFDVSRAYDEAGGLRDPKIWTAERDREMWEALQG
ncbi:MBL fold metallo-hydrolase [Azospirillum soli]|uniref:MBL fold metallo-hydrolase n=1 Tax=Azospirillum soli TaxID=1304799 RepID=UPI001AE3CF2D|nr:MBL fold metallo-hydrolase [Azospirillum soli]MBP2313560.1 glyoxylase-like metal-dependent hydrolase (beta-lactamase superfamily II) [Azospirillum soli]